MKTYRELLRDPRWQRKRLEILSLDNFTCRNCSSKTKTLNAHHLYYDREVMPWDYDNCVLITLCDECHDKAHRIEWKRAFLDLNISEFDLLEIAIQLKFRKQKLEDKLRDLHEKHKCRMKYFYMAYNLFESQEEIDEYYTGFARKNKEKYNG